MKHDIYTYKLKGYSWLRREIYSILFEECEVRTFTGSKEDVVQIVFLLNTAYYLGFSSGQIVGSLGETQ